MKRQLTAEEIGQLERQGCTAEEWTKVLVEERFDANQVRHTSFRGDVEIGEEVRLDHIGVIENYAIGNHVTICRVNELVTDKWIELLLGEDGVTVGNEAGEPNIPFSFFPNEKRDWIGVHYPSFISSEHDSDKKSTSPQGLIGDNCTIKNCDTIHNVNADKDVCLEGVAHLENGLLHEGSHIGTQVIARKFIIGPRTKVTDGAKLYHVITTNDCKIGKGFMAENCYFGHHCEMFCGEACAIFAGPHTVSHHKSTLLIGGEFSFYNAGSNTNQSNHAYKLGPVHHGTLARGSKTASGSHILWPMQTGPFTMVMGKVKTHPDLSDLPFSYVIADGEKVFVAPGMNLGTAGTFRDILKWRQRGKSLYTGEYDFLSPFVMQSVFKGIDTLESLQKEYGFEVEEYPYNGTVIRRSALLKGLDRYQLAIRLYANKVTPTTEIHNEACNWHWIDVAGLPMVEELLPQSYGYLTARLKEKESAAELNALYITQSQQWGATMLAHRYGESFTSGALQQEGEEAVKVWKSLLIADAYKELDLGDMPEYLVENFSQKVEQNCKEVL